MLQAIRDRATGWIAWVVIILICIPFALWGIQEFQTPDQGLVVARVNDTEIDYYQYRDAYQQQRERIRQMLGGNVPPSVLEDGRLREQTLEGLIADELLVQTSLRNGLRVGDAQLASAINNQPAFQSNGKFSQTLYDGFLRTRGTSAAGFEYDLRRSMLGEQVITALRRTVIVTDSELDSAMRVRTQERRFQMVEIDPRQMQMLQPSDDEVRKWFESHPEDYVKPEQVAIRYLELSRDDIASKITVEEEVLRNAYERDKANYRVEEQREARHILINVARDADEAVASAARERIEALRARIEGGEDFAEVAKTSSEDPGSAPLGGALGAFGRGLMDPAFEEVAFSLAEGALSEPVRTRFGWHLIQVTGIRPEQVRSFDDARADVLREYQDREADLVFAEQAERLATLAFEHPESLEVASEALGLTIKTSDLFSRDGRDAGGVAAIGRVREAAYSEDVLRGGNNGPLLQVGPDRVLVLRVAEHEESRPHTLEEVRSRVVDRLRSDAASKKAAEIGERLLAALRGGADMADAAAGDNLKWGEERTVVRQQPGPLAEVAADALFAMPRPEGSRPTFAGAQLPDGRYVVLALHAVGQAAQDEKTVQESRDRVARSLEAGYGEQAFTAVMRSLRQSADVQVLEENLRVEDG